MAQQGYEWSKNDYIFGNLQGDIPAACTLTAWFKDFVRRNDLPDIHLHSLRHTAATLLIDGNCPITAVAGTLGHATPRDHDHHLRPRHSAGYRKVCCGHSGLVWK